MMDANPSECSTVLSACLQITMAIPKRTKPCNRRERPHQVLIRISYQTSLCYFLLIENSISYFHRDGLSGRLKPPIRFIYCRYSLFFSLRTPPAALPTTRFPLVESNPPNPIMACMAAMSLSSTSTSSSFSLFFPIGSPRVFRSWRLSGVFLSCSALLLLLP